MDSSAPTLTLLIILATLPFISANPRTSQAGFFCGLNITPSTATYIPIYVRQMDVLGQRITTAGGSNNLWADYALTEQNVSIYSLTQCYSDLSRDDCLQCYAAIRSSIPRCVPAVAGLIYLDGCFIRYDSYDFFNESVNPAYDTRNCNTTLGEASDLGFRESVRRLVDGLVGRAVVGGGHAVGGDDRGGGVFGLAQCWGSLSRDGCRECLDKASREVRGCLPSREGRALITGCYLRYSTQRFYGNNSQGADHRHGEFGSNF